MHYYAEPSRQLPIAECDVVVAGGGTAGVVAALASARMGAKTILVEAKGYTGGTVVEGGTALHSFYNLWKAFPGVEKRQVVKGIPQEIVSRLERIGGTSGHAEMTKGYDYDSVCTAIDVELYKLTTMEMLDEAGVGLHLNTRVSDAVREGSSLRGVVTESRNGREALWAKAFVDCTGYGDLSSVAGARFTEPNDHCVANSIGVGGVSLERYAEFLKAHNALGECAEGDRSGAPARIVRVSALGLGDNLPPEFRKAIGDIGMSLVTTSVHDNYFMFIKLNHKMPVSPTDRDASAAAELELRRRQHQAIQIIRTYIPGCEKAFIARTSPSLCIRRGRCVACDHDLSLREILDAMHHEDDIMAYGFHDCAPRLKIRDGGTYGIPYRALRVRGIDNLLAAGMLITSDWHAHMSTRNTVASMGQGQAAGTAAALCADRGCGTRALPYAELRHALLAHGVCLDN